MTQAFVIIGGYHNQTPEFIKELQELLPLHMFKELLRISTEPTKILMQMVRYEAGLQCGGCYKRIAAYPAEHTKVSKKTISQTVSIYSQDDKYPTIIVQYTKR